MNKLKNDLRYRYYGNVSMKHLSKRRLFVLDFLIALWQAIQFAGLFAIVMMCVFTLLLLAKIGLYLVAVGFVLILYAIGVAIGKASCLL